MLGMSRKKTFAWFFTLSLVGGAFGFSIVILLWFVNGAVGTTATLAAAVKSTTPIVKEANLLSGIDIELQYPGIFDQVSHIKNDSNALEQYNLGSNANYRRAIGISVHPLPSNNFSDDSNYRFRLNSANTYKETKSFIGKEPISLMTKIDHTEQTLFWVHQGKILAVAVTSTEPKDDVLKMMAVIQPTIKWKQ
jgi:hypothetical protein